MEYFDVVNEKDEVISKASREECHSNPKLIHRASNVYIFDSLDLKNILRVKRSNQVDTEIGKWTILIGEHNKIGEDYKTAIKRGVFEEIGLKDIILKTFGEKVICRMKNQTEISQNFIGIYKGSTNNLKLDKEEIAKVEFIPIKKLLEDIKNNKDSYASYIESALKVILSEIQIY